MTIVCKLVVGTDNCSSIMLLFYAMSELRSCSLEKKTSLKYLLLASQIGITGDRMTREKEKKIRI